jgi:chitinase
LAYTVSVNAAGSYTLTARVTANGPGGTFHVEVGGANVTGPLTVPNTGGWQNWTNVTATVTLAAGVQQMRVIVDGLGSTGRFAFGLTGMASLS